MKNIRDRGLCKYHDVLQLEVLRIVQDGLRHGQVRGIHTQNSCERGRPSLILELYGLSSCLTVPGDDLNDTQRKLEPFLSIFTVQLVHNATTVILFQ